MPVVGSGQSGNTANLSGSTTVTKLLIKDHLGSMVAEVVVVGTPGAPTMAGSILIHGFGPWGNARNLAAKFAEGDRGFTGHEHLADLGLIHMNGRLYDPVLGRFLQADPIIQAPHNVQSHNRYVYVLNNPLSFTDPSGFSFWTQYRGMIFGLATAWFLGPGSFTFFGSGGIFGSTAIFGAGGAFTGTVAGVSTNAFASAIAAGFAAGGIQGGNIQSALQGAFFAGLTAGLAGAFNLHGVASGFGDPKLYGQVALHAAMGCAQSAAAGGSCRSGAIGSGVSAFASPMLEGLKGPGKLIASAIVGGVASRLSGGKFENGAMSAAFGYLFNEAVQRNQADGSNGSRKLNLLSPTDDSYPAAVRTAVAPGEFEVIAHGPKVDGVLTTAQTASGLTVEQLARRIEQHPDWTPELKVRLNACWLGQIENGYAQQLANRLGVEVIASPVRTVTIGPIDFGPWHTADVGSNGSYFMLKPMPWITYQPRKVD